MSIAPHFFAWVRIRVGKVGYSSSHPVVKSTTPQAVFMSARQAALLPPCRQEYDPSGSIHVGKAGCRPPTLASRVRPLGQHSCRQGRLPSSHPVVKNTTPGAVFMSARQAVVLPPCRQEYDPSGIIHVGKVGYPPPTLSSRVRPLRHHSCRQGRLPSSHPVIKSTTPGAVFMSAR